MEARIKIWINSKTQIFFFVSVQPTSTTLFGVPFPHPGAPPQGRRDSQLRTMPEREIRMVRKATPRTWSPLWQTYHGRSARVAASLRPESRASPPHVLNLPERSTSQPWIQLTGGYARCQTLGGYARSQKLSYYLLKLVPELHE